MLEGDLQLLTLVLWEEPGYLIYFPKNQWILEHLQEEGRTVDRWEPAVNPDITLRVVHLGQAPQEDADSYMAALFGSFHSEGWENGRYEGADTQAFRLLRARLITGGKNYLLLAEYPYEGAEGFGAHLEPVMDSFRILPD